MKSNRPSEMTAGSCRVMSFVMVAPALIKLSDCVVVTPKAVLASVVLISSIRIDPALSMVIVTLMLAKAETF